MDAADARAATSAMDAMDATDATGASREGGGGGTARLLQRTLDVCVWVGGDRGGGIFMVGKKACNIWGERQRSANAALSQWVNLFSKEGRCFWWCANQWR
jgi:hypothetical protein